MLNKVGATQGESEGDGSAQNIGAQNSPIYQKGYSGTTKVALIVLDGWGYREEVKDNAIAAAPTPHFDALWKTFPHTLLAASGEAVGLPEGQMGNSEVGHTTIGAGRALDTDLVRIGKVARSGEFSALPPLAAAFAQTRAHDSTLHVMGLVSPGGVHSHSAHLYAILRAAKEAGVPHVAVHAFTDGRDTAPTSAAGYLMELEKVMEEIGIGHIATTSGRYFAMDRDNNWERVARVESVLFHGEGKKVFGMKPSEFLPQLYQEGVVDEHLEPTIFLDENGDAYRVSQNDAVVFFNFRPDRARMIARRVLEYGKEKNVMLVTMTEYDSDIGAPVLFGTKTIETTLAREVSLAGLSQAHIAETEKFAHATYFLNGGVSTLHAGEEHLLIESRKDIVTHDQVPEMKAREIAESVVDAMTRGVDFLFVNIANADMVGHTGNVAAIIEGLMAADTALGHIVDGARRFGYTLVISADHGNAELNKDQETGEVHTAHTTNEVPCIITTNDNVSLRDGGGLADLAPTVLALLGLPIPTAMFGKNLLTQ